MNGRYCITGTDTDVGKTVFAAALAGFLRARYWKPIQAGLEGETDSLAVARLSGGNASLVVEGAGGVLVPLRDDLLSVDQFAHWGMPVVLVARTNLGTINHSLLSLEALRSRGIAVHGIVFSGEGNPASEQAITAIGRVRHLGRLPRLDPLNAATLASAFVEHIHAGAFA
jgi:dethiobiotin synthetase